MKNNRDYILLIAAIIIIALTVHLLHGSRIPDFKPDINIEQVKILFPGAERINPNSGPWLQVFDSSNNLLGAVISSQPESNQITGYGGSVPILIGINPQQKITGLVMLENYETPAFAEKVRNSNFLAGWNGIKWQDAIQKDVNTVTGATMTSSAIRDSLKTKLASLDSTAVKNIQSGPGLTWIDFIIIAIGLAGILLCKLKVKNLKNIRYFLFILSIGFLGFFTAAMYSFYVLSVLLINGTLPAGSTGLLILVLLAVSVPVITGENSYCFFTCPFGALQEIIFKIFPWKFKIKPVLQKKLKYIRYLLLVFLTVILLTGWTTDINNFEPFSAFKPTAAGISALAIAIVSLILATGVNRPWCNWGCSAGAFLDLLKRPRKGETACPGMDNKSSQNNSQKQESQK
ncbi:MAG: 4Fe-4S binding protein [Vulcanimicrobiota bacterium]